MKGYSKRFMNAKNMMTKWILFAVSITLFVNAKGQQQSMLLEQFGTIERKLEELVRGVKSLGEMVVDIKRNIDITIRELENLVDHIKYIEGLFQNTTEKFDATLNSKLETPAKIIQGTENQGTGISSQNVTTLKQVSNTPTEWTNLSEDEKKQALENCQKEEREKTASVDELQKKLAQALADKTKREIREQAYLKKIQDLETERENLAKNKSLVDRENEELKKSTEKDKKDLEQLGKEVSDLKQRLNNLLLKFNLRINYGKV